MKVELREEIVKYTYACDVCGDKVEHHRACGICGIDLCSKCTRFDPRDMGDYSSIYCINCFQTGQKYLERINAEQEKFDILIEEIEQEWRDEVIKNRQKIETVE